MTIETETFADLCKQLGNHTDRSENALLCYRAYKAYLNEHPDTGRGKGNKTDRDPDCPTFSKAAAKESGVAKTTIDALLQVGKAIARLPDAAKAALASSSLRNSMRMLRKLATEEHEKDRAEVITKFAKEEKADPPSAKARLKTKLGMTPSGREGVEAETIDPKSSYCATGEYLELKAGRFLFRVEVGEYTAGRVHLTATALKGERVQAAPFMASPKKTGTSAKPAAKPTKATAKAA